MGVRAVGVQAVRSGPAPRRHGRRRRDRGAGGRPDAAGHRLGLHDPATPAGRAVAGRDGGRTGINVWVPVADETATVARLRDDGYAVAPGALYRIASPPGLRITVSGLDVDRIEALADAVARATRPGRSGMSA